MSDASSFLSGVSFMSEAGHQRGASATDAYMPPAEMFKVNHGGGDDWGIPGYSVPKKSITYRSTSFKVTKTKRRTMFDELDKTAKNPDPTKYQPDVTKIAVDKKHRPTFRAKRNTYIDQIFKTGSLSPGPGSHFPPDEKSLEVDKKKLRGASFTRSEGLSYLTSIEFQSLESPGAGHYFQEPKGGDKKPAGSLRNSFYFMKHPDKPEKPGSKLGPGVYHTIDYVADPKKDKLKADPLRTSPPRPIMPKAKRESVLEAAAKLKKGVPGVGTYKDAVKPLEGFTTDPRRIHFFTARSKGPRFPETHVKGGSGAPGPGKYSHEDYEDRLKKKS